MARLLIMLVMFGALASLVWIGWVCLKPRPRQSQRSAEPTPRQRLERIDRGE